MNCDGWGGSINEGGGIVGSKCGIADAGLFVEGVGRRFLLGTDLDRGGGGGTIPEGGGIVRSKFGGSDDAGSLVDAFENVEIDSESADGGRVVEAMTEGVDTVASRARTCSFRRESILVICVKLS